MDSVWIAVLFALFVWWFSTGAILWLVRRADNQGTRGHFGAGITGDHREDSGRIGR